MKKILLIVLMAIAFHNAEARYQYSGYDNPKCYIGFSGGIDNPGGIIAFNVDIPVVDFMSLSGGAGYTFWGTKVFGEGRFYLQPDHRGFALSAGVSYSTGFKRLEIPDQQVGYPGKYGGTVYASETVVATLHPKTNAFASAYYFFSMGQRHRFYLQAGYSMELNDTEVTVHSPSNVYFDYSKTNNLDLLAPGGFIGAVGFSFGIGGGRY